MIGPVVNLIFRSVLKMLVGKGVMAPRVGEEIEPEQFCPEDWRTPPPDFTKKPPQE